MCSLVIHTSDEPGAGTDSGVAVQLHGTLGSSPQASLHVEHIKAQRTPVCCLSADLSGASSPAMSREQRRTVASQCSCTGPWTPALRHALCA